MPKSSPASSCMCSGRNFAAALNYEQGPTRAQRLLGNCTCMVLRCLCGVRVFIPSKQTSGTSKGLKDLAGVWGHCRKQNEAFGRSYSYTCKSHS